MKNSLKLSAVLIGLAAAQVGHAGVTVYKEGEKFVKIGGRIQMQYKYQNPNNGQSTDDLFFRRFRPYIEGSVHKDWKGKFQFDLGKANGNNEVALKDVYMQYSGGPAKVTIGNTNFPFSREFLTSSKRQELVERTFVGDHNYGTPDRQMGIKLNGSINDKVIDWALMGAKGAIDPDNRKLDFDTLANKNSDFNQGWMVGGRVDYNPFGYLKMSQGAFSSDLKATISLAAFGWRNDNNNNAAALGNNNPASKADVDKVDGVEVSGAFRLGGISVDAEYNRFNADLVQGGISSGLYANSKTTLTNWSVEGGYMVLPAQLEMVAAYQSQDADGYADIWNRQSVGANYFIHKHDVKVQLTYEMNQNRNGVRNADEDVVYLQSQYVF